MLEPEKALDAYTTLKPGEIPFTLQAGDPSAPALVLLWAHIARVRAGVGTFNPSVFSSDTYEFAPAESAEESTDLLVRATAAEQIAWKMQDYQKGISEDIEEAAPDTSSGSPLFRLDVYDARRALGNECSRADAHLLEKVEAVEAFEHSEAEQLRYASAFHKIKTARDLLRAAALMFFPAR